jgi:uncharacterized integral membrane protein (TIGR00698 family)
MKLTEDYTAILISIVLIIIASLAIPFGFPSIAWNGWSEFSAVMGSISWMNLLVLLAVSFAVILLASYLKGEPLSLFHASGYVFIFLITFIAHTLTGFAPAKNIGLEIVIFSLLIGLFISNFLSVPQWVKPLLQTELYIKIGLVLLGCGILFGDIMKAGSLGMIQSIIVVIAVWQFCYWLGKKFGLDDEYRTMLSSAVAICGVSAAIATSGVIKGDNKKLSYVISLVLITAVPMLLFMPYIAKSIGLNDATAGAWMGGTIDTTGAVVAAGNMLGEEGLKYATVVKFSQNVLLGLAAFAISVYWTYTKKETTEKPTARMIWERFPKFVLGFIVASLIFSFALPAEMVSNLKAPLKNIQTFWFALAFTCIGLETRFADIFNKDSKKPAAVFLIAQVFNILVTLAVAWLIFGQNE